jgi:hypothetical protein
MPEVHVNGISLYYEQHGEGAPVLCIHGGSLIEGKKDGTTGAHI